MGRIPACVGPPAAAECGLTSTHGAEEIPPGIRRSASALTAITADLAGPGEPCRQLVAEATLIIRAGGDGRLHSRPITDPDRACCQQDVA
jgi:hypothetical protein